MHTGIPNPRVDTRGYNMPRLRRFSPEILLEVVQLMNDCDCIALPRNDSQPKIRHLFW
jgi:hypothetical protein